MTTAAIMILPKKTPTPKKWTSWEAGVGVQSGVMLFSTSSALGNVQIQARVKSCDWNSEDIIATLLVVAENTMFLF